MIIVQLNVIYATETGVLCVWGGGGGTAVRKKNKTEGREERKRKDKERKYERKKRKWAPEHLLRSPQVQ